MIRGYFVACGSDVHAADRVHVWRVCGGSSGRGVRARQAEQDWRRRKADQTGQFVSGGAQGGGKALDFAASAFSFGLGDACGKVVANLGARLYTGYDRPGHVVASTIVVPVGTRVRGRLARTDPQPEGRAGPRRRPPG